jgi:D-alanine transaminase
MTTAYLNGQFLPLEETKISAMDRGFLFGDGVYEVIPVYNGHAFRLEQHLDRLARSLAAIQLSTGFEQHAWKSLIAELIQRNDGGDQSVYLQCTRGPSPVRDHAFPAQITPTIFAYSIPLPTRSIKELSKGISALTVADLRWQRCDIKAITLLPNILMRQHAIENGAQEAILINKGHAIEGSAMNLFVIKNNLIKTPPLGQQILGGVTRDLVLELAKQYNHPYQEINIPEADLFSADEIWLTSSNREVMPVIKLNNKSINDNQPGPLWHKMIHYYQAFKNQFKGN